MRITQLISALLILQLAAANVYGAELEKFAADDGTFLIDWRDEFSASEKQKLRDWLTHMGETASLLHGEWPRKRIRIALKAYRDADAVTFGRVLRNRPEGVLFYVNPERPVDEFVASWTPYHEFAHLFIPYPGRADSWFSEGLASYYQNILQQRAGVLTATEVRERFAAAFQRGEDDNGHDDLTLGELSADMMKRRAFMRIYWSGALYFMEADIALRRMSEPRTLDDVLRAYNACCLPQGEERRGRILAADFDKLTGTTLFIDLYEKYESSRAIPFWRTILEQADEAGAFDSSSAKIPVT